MIEPELVIVLDPPRALMPAASPGAVEAPVVLIDPELMIELKLPPARMPLASRPLARMDPLLMIWFRLLWEVVWIPAENTVSMDPLFTMILLLSRVCMPLALEPWVRIVPLLVMLLDPPFAKIPSALLPLSPEPLPLVWMAPLFVI